MRLDAAITEFFYSKDFTPDSKRFYHRTLATFSAWAAEQGVTDVADLTSALLRRYAATLRQRISPRTGKPLTRVSQHGYVNALRTFLNFCAREEWLDERVPSRLEMPRKETKVLPVLSTVQMQLLFRAADQTSTPERDRAILALLLDGGLRVGELCRLTLDDVHLHTQDAWLTLHGKGRKKREVPLGRLARRALARYLHSARHAPSAEQHALLGKRGPLTQAGVDKLLYTLRDAAGTQHFTGVRVSAHTCRHTFAVRYLQAMTARQARMGAVSVLDAL